MFASFTAWLRRRGQEPLDQRQSELTPAEVDEVYLSTLREQGPDLTLDQLASGWDRDLTRDWVASAEKRGWLARSDDGRWRLTDEGRECLKRNAVFRSSITVGLPARRR